eukprot:CAMPEP_0115863850 /NCGR_PEP_ID=MMETSP0287-20121206/18897_1 /TAXON_ID=412157 /ORGANISM="Chrysochromulina rotalis, Strain UIO044" /LENGTH=147 /DNA_ID=CAMNT_0003318301 /DNA_START=122 /DNA_END=565 /DNA_ORIENTATION=+
MQKGNTRATARSPAPATSAGVLLHERLDLCTALRRSCGEHLWWRAIRTDEHVVLNADADALAPVGQVRVVRGEVEPRLHCDDHALLEHRARGHGGCVMHIEPQPVADRVGVVPLAARVAVAVSAIEEPEGDEILVRPLHRQAMQRVE